MVNFKDKIHKSTTSDFWLIVKNDLKNDFKSIIWNSWIKPLEFEKYIDDKLYIKTPSELVKNRIENQYYDQIFVKTNIHFKNLKKIKFSVENDLKVPLLNNSKISHKEPTLSSISFTDNDSKILNNDFLFNNFVVDETNELAYLSAKRISQRFNSDYNPLFIYGDVGIGKTHLLNSIAWEIKNERKREFIYISAERFMYQFIKALKSNETLKFKDQFRSVDMLMIDDLQFIGGKKSTQEEFFHLLNDLIHQNKQVIVTADKSPTNLTDLDYKIKSRLSGGLVVDIQPTTYELRLKIIKNKIKSKQMHLNKDVTEFLAKNIYSSVRELEGALNKIIVYSDIINSKISLDNTKEILSDFLSKNNKKITIKDIQLQVSKYFNLQFYELCSKNRSRYISRPRQIGMFLSKEMTDISYPDIGKLFGGKDHATVIHGVNKIKDLSETDNKLRQDLENIRIKLNSIDS